MNEKPEFPQNVAAFISLRERLGLSRQALARALHVSTQAISKCETSISPPALYYFALYGLAFTQYEPTKQSQKYVPLTTEQIAERVRTRELAKLEARATFQKSPENPSVVETQDDKLLRQARAKLARQDAFARARAERDQFTRDERAARDESYRAQAEGLIRTIALRAAETWPDPYARGDWLAALARRLTKEYQGDVPHDYRIKVVEYIGNMRQGDGPTDPDTFLALPHIGLTPPKPTGITS